MPAFNHEQHKTQVKNEKRPFFAKKFDFL